MCDVCKAVVGHNIGCPERPYDEDDYKKTCPICGVEYDEDDMLWSVCDSCLSKASTFENALAYGDHNKASVEVNGLFAKILTLDQINEALKAVVLDVRKYYFDVFARLLIEFIDDDTSDFADWLVEWKKGGG